MNLTEQEIEMGLMVVTCKCCGSAHKAHKEMNACSYSFTPNFGCAKCQGVTPKNRVIAAQAKGLQRRN